MEAGNSFHLYARTTCREAGQCDRSLCTSTVLSTQHVVAMSRVLEKLKAMDERGTEKEGKMCQMISLALYELYNS